MAIVNPNDRTLTELTNQSMATSFTSNWILLIQNLAFSFQMNWTGSPVGIFSIQFSNDSSQSPSITPTKPIDYAASNTSTSGFSGAIISWDDPIVPHNWVRLIYTATSGSGVLTSVEYNGR